MNKLPFLFHPSKKATILTTIGFLLFVSIVLPLISTLTTSLIGVSEAPDTSFFYTPNELISLLDSYGVYGRHIYITMRWTFDVIWPLVYTFFFFITYSFFSTKRYLLWIPTVAVLFDFFENIAMTIHMSIYPQTVTWLLAISPYITLIKWLGIGITMIVLGYLVLQTILQKKTLK